MRGSLRGEPAAFEIDDRSAEIVCESFLEPRWIRLPQLVLGLRVEEFVALDDDIIFSPLIPGSVPDRLQFVRCCSRHLRK